MVRRCYIALAVVAAGLLATEQARARAAACESAPCTSDGDCGDGTRCVGGAAAACAPDDGSTCSACIVAWQAACQISSDCGDGFVCSFPAGSCDDAASDGEPGKACDAATQSCGNDAAACPTGGTCTAANEPCDASGCGADAICAGGMCVPQTWSCSGPSCVPPCFGVEPDGGQLALAPPEGATASPGYAPGPPAGCGCRTATAPLPPAAWFVALGAMVAVRRRWKTTRSKGQEEAA